MCEKRGLVGGIQRFSTSDGPGIRTTIFLKGCPLSCSWCHNPELIGMKTEIIFNPDKCIGCLYCIKECLRGAIFREPGEQRPKINWQLCDGCQACAQQCAAEALSPVGKSMTVEEVMDEVVRDKDFYDKSGGGVTISGGELLTQHRFAQTIMEACLAQGIPVVIDTSGFGPTDVLISMARKAQKILYDIKLIVPDEHKRMTGQDNEIILKNLSLLADDKEISSKLILRMPMIKGINDTEEVIQKTKEFITAHGLREVTLLPYHQLGVSKTRHLGKEPILYEPPDHDRLTEIAKLFRDQEISVEILGEEISSRYT